MDVTEEAGLSSELHPPSLKYGGASIADLDGDGYPDLLFGHHVDNMSLYFNSRDGTFLRYSFSLSGDIHGISPIRFSSSHKSMHFLVSLGGSNGEARLAPRLFSVSADRLVVEKEDKGLLNSAGRGRTVIGMNAGGPNSRSLIDLMILNGRNGEENSVDNSDEESKHHFLLMGQDNGTFIRDDNSVSNNLQIHDRNWFGTVTDMNNNGRMEILTYNKLQVYTMLSSIITNITSFVLPRGIDVRGISSIAELDYDNDGYMDLYIARSTSSHGTAYLEEEPGMIAPNDMLLKNTKNGKYVDISSHAGIPEQTQSKGVTTGDFNNDGYVDILLIQEYPPHILMFNNGDHTFRLTNANITTNNSNVGDMASAIDYNLDGKLDIVLSEGHYADRSLSGGYSLLKNIGPIRNYLIIRVGSSPNNGKATSLHALVKVSSTLNDDDVDHLNMIRRVGSPGVAVSISYLENVHFGLGHRSQVAIVEITWIDGQVVTLFNVASNQIITVGEV